MKMLIELRSCPWDKAEPLQMLVIEEGMPLSYQLSAKPFLMDKDKMVEQFKKILDTLQSE